MGEKEIKCTAPAVNVSNTPWFNLTTRTASIPKSCPLIVSYSVDSAVYTFQAVWIEEPVLPKLKS